MDNLSRAHSRTVAGMFRRYLAHVLAESSHGSPKSSAAVAARGLLDGSRDSYHASLLTKATSWRDDTMSLKVAARAYGAFEGFARHPDAEPPESADCRRALQAARALMANGDQASHRAAEAVLGGPVDAAAPDAGRPPAPATRFGSREEWRQAALAEHERTIIPHSPYRKRVDFEIRSECSDETYRILGWTDRNPYRCTCLGFHQHKRCKHIQAVTPVLIHGGAAMDDRTTCPADARNPSRCPPGPGARRHGSNPSNRPKRRRRRDRPRSCSGPRCSCAIPWPTCSTPWKAARSPSPRAR